MDEFIKIIFIVKSHSCLSSFGSMPKSNSDVNIGKYSLFQAFRQWRAVRSKESDEKQRGTERLEQATENNTESYRCNIQRCLRHFFSIAPGSVYDQQSQFAWGATVELNLKLMFTSNLINFDVQRSRNHKANCNPDGHNQFRVSYVP